MALFTTLLNRRPHPNAARVFLNWLFSKDGQVHLQKVMRYQSPRVDIGTEGVDPEKIRETGIKYFPDVKGDLGWLQKEDSRYLNMARQIFGGK